MRMKLRWFQRTGTVLTMLAFGLFVLLFGPAIYAGCFNRVRRFSHHQRFFYQQPVFYQVGAGLREESIATRAAELAIRRFAQLQAGVGAASNAAQPQSSKPDASAAREVLSKSCLRCHSGGSPKGGLDLSGELSPALKMKAAILAFKGDMPPPGQGERISDQAAETLFNWSLK